MDMSLKLQRVLTRTIQLTTIGLLIGPISLLNATPLALSTVPLFLGTSVEANIILTLDDSGSMHWEQMPSDNRTRYIYPRASGIYGGSDYGNRVPVFSNVLSYSVRARSPDVNKIYYNPKITYAPWSTATGSSFGNASITCAPHNPQNPSTPASVAVCRNLTVTNTQWAKWDTYNGSAGGFPGGVNSNNGTLSFWPAVYYSYTGGVFDGTTDWNAANFTEVLIVPVVTTYTGGPDRSDCTNATTCTYNEEIQNFANWYTYYRSRVLTSRAGIGQAFARQGTNIRVGFAAINVGARTIDGVASNRAMVRGVRTFSGADRATFYNDLYGHIMPRAGTPLRTALKAVGDYYERTDNDGPWSEDPGSSSSTSHLSCRQSFNILMTDGYYNGASPSVGSVDSTAGTTITGPNSASFLYTPGAPFSDAYSNTLADTAMEYWVRDLRPGLANRVPTNPVDDAFWQHMVNFTVGLGVEGSLDPVADLPGVQAGTTPWPDPTNGDDEHIDDLWHAGLNSRGGFFSASDPVAFADTLSDILSDISDRIGSAASVALNTGSITSGSKVYQARFDSGNWTGQLFAFPINLVDGSLGTAVWDAASLIPASGSRVIVTHDGVNPQQFIWSDLSTAQQGQLKIAQVVEYIRGDNTYEANIITPSNDAVLVANGFPPGGFRNRASLLGDLVHSAPTHVGVTDFQYPDDWGASGVNEPEDSAYYSSYVAWQQLQNSGNGRTPIVYVGANDGMLHAFNANSGVEMFGFVPNEIYSGLVNLPDPNRNHQFYVDGSPTTVDAFIGGSWKTILVSGLRGGGQGLFAIDISNPAAFNTESSAKSKVMWEFTDNDADTISTINSNFDADLGYTFGQPSIVRMHNGKWAAVFGNGYNNTIDNDADGTINDSSTGNAILYIVDLATGDLIRKIDTGKGSTDDLTGNNYPNGLSEPAVVDIDGDSIVDYAYAGDLLGNLWKFDLTSTTAASWDVAYSQPLYKACASTTCTASTFQPITSRPQVGLHPVSGVIIYFGTGKYFETGDNVAVGQTNQTFYGIWDKNLLTLTTFDRSNLLEQTILLEVGQFSEEERASTDLDINWANHSGWFMDLYNHESGNTNNYGERQVSSSVLRNGRIIFTTLIPDDGDPCSAGGTSWFMEIDALSGARLPYTPFDLNNDKKFNEKDYIEVDIDGDGKKEKIPASGKKSKVGILPTPGIVASADGKIEYKYESGSSGTIEVIVENPGAQSPGRQSWRYLEN